MNDKEQIDGFLKSGVFGVVGASSDPRKYGNKVLRCFLQNNLKAIPVNPREKSIEGVDCVASVMELPVEVVSISVITPPQITEQVIEMAARKGIRNVWMQPGAESAKAVEFCKRNNINVIAGGSCILVVLGFHDS